MEDQEKRRKRQREHGDLEAKAARSKAGTETPPSSKEVEEFFEILRRMHVAVRYFDNKVNGDGDGKIFSGRLWDALESGRLELELANAAAAAATTTSEGDCSDLRAETVANERVTENNRVFDLNIEPDQDITEIAANTGAN